jgi:hypothetical protein
LRNRLCCHSLPGIPPDNYMAVSNGKKAVAVMNQLIAVHDATTGSYLYHKGLSQFTASVGLSSTGTTIHIRLSPKVVYDPEADRFICAILCEKQTNIITLFWVFRKVMIPQLPGNFTKCLAIIPAILQWC